MGGIRESDCVDVVFEGKGGLGLRGGIGIRKFAVRRILVEVGIEIRGKSFGTELLHTTY